jgi:uncharacterized protein (DUF1330 family)
MAVYATVLINIHDSSTYALYTAGWLDVWKTHGVGCEVLAVDDDPIVIEGKWPSYRTVIMRFPSEAAFNAWYQSPEYQDLVRHRHAASTASFALIREFTVPATSTPEA